MSNLHDYIETNEEFIKKSVQKTYLLSDFQVDLYIKRIQGKPFRQIAKETGKTLGSINYGIDVIRQILIQNDKIGADQYQTTASAFYKAIPF